jgi:two-component system, chemotaxis family, chemotaxis protein CheY
MTVHQELGTVPKKRGSPLGLVSASTNIQGVANTPGRILVVDDDEFMRRLLQLHLTNHGFDVTLAEDAVVAGHLMLRDKPDLVIVDVHMPYMDGYEFVAAMKSDPATRDIPVVFLTTDDGVASHASRLGAAAYLQKPVMADRLLEVVALFASSTAGLKHGAQPR